MRITPSALVVKIAASALVVLCALVPACTRGSEPRETGLAVVAGFYPLAWAAAEIGGDAVAVRDLTPVGGEAHDIQLSARQRSAVQTAKLVLLLGKGFQPEVERAAKDSSGKVVDLSAGLNFRSGDPHVWLDPEMMQRIVRGVAEALSSVDPAHSASFTQRADALEAELKGLDEAYRSELANCRLKIVVTIHQAFGYVTARYGLTQLALTGSSPEGEPSAAQIQRVRELGRQRKVAAVFFEPTKEGARIGDRASLEAGVPALPMHTLEFDPLPENYLTQMRKNLGKLQEGLLCR